MKVVYNACYGGFGLSDKAIKLYLDLSKTPYVEIKVKSSFGSDVNFYKTVPDLKLQAMLLEDSWHSDFTDEQRKWVNDNMFSINRDLERHDPILVQIVEELGKEASNMSARLEIAEIKGNKYRINEYDGSESVDTPESAESEWTVV